MIHQIALYRLVPQMREELHGFISETNGHLVDLDTDDSPAMRGRKLALRSKYGVRLTRAQKLLMALTDLDRCLHE